MPFHLPKLHWSWAQPFHVQCRMHFQAIWLSPFFYYYYYYFLFVCFFFFFESAFTVLFKCLGQLNKCFISHLRVEMITIRNILVQRAAPLGPGLHFFHSPRKNLGKVLCPVLFLANSLACGWAVKGKISIYVLSWTKKWLRHLFFFHGGYNKLTFLKKAWVSAKASLSYI